MRKAATGRKTFLIKTWGIHAMHHGWTLAEVLAKGTKLRRLTAEEIERWAKEQRAKGWPKE
jgi:hypothetical protein